MFNAFNLFYYTLANFVCGGYTVFTSVHNALFPEYLEESLLDFHQTLQTCSYTHGKKLGNTKFSANYFHVGVNNKKIIFLTRNIIISLWNLEQYKVKMQRK